MQLRITHCKFLLLTIVSILIACNAIGAEIVFIVQHDRYYWLVDQHALMKILMTFMGLSYLTCIFSNIYAFYIWEILDQNSHDNLGAESVLHTRKLWLKISKGIVIVLGFITFSVTIYSLLMIEKQFETEGILGWMKLYKSDARVKKAIDHLQISWKCCGHLSYSNWTDTNVKIDPGPHDIQNQNLRFVPFSCCNSASPRPCVHDEIEKSNRYINYNYPKDLSVYPEGCSVLLKSSYKSWLLIILGLTGLVLAYEVLSVLAYSWILTNDRSIKKSSITKSVPTLGVVNIKKSSKTQEILG